MEKKMIASNKLLAISFLISLWIFSSTTKASEQVLATITTDLNSLSYHFVVDSGEYQQVLDAFYIDNYNGSAQLNRDILPIENFISEGFIFPKKNGPNFVKISGENFDTALGGTISIDILTNAITGKRKTYNLNLSPGLSGWKLFYLGNEIHQIKVLGNKIPIIGLVGARELEIN